MAYSKPTHDFSSFSLNELEMEMSSFQDMMGSNVNYDDGDIPENIGGQEEYMYDSGEDLEEKYAFEENEKSHVAQEDLLRKLREYQKELSVNALQGQNTIICAPTGSGKTLVATYIIREHFKQSDGIPKKVAFLARVVSLADQQYKYLCKYLPSLKIALITGKSTNCMSLHLSLPHNDIIVMTPTILVNHLKSKHVPNLGVFSLLMFDECHHTRKGEPYNTLMGDYHKTKKQITEARRGEQLNITLPQIVGLTASIGIEGAEILEVARENILKVCANLDVLTMSTIEDNKGELMEAVPVPKEKFKVLHEREDDESVCKIIEIMQKLEEAMEVFAKELHNCKLNEEIGKKPANRKGQEYEQWAISTMKVVKAIPINSGCSNDDIHIRLIAIAALYLKEYRFALETYDLVELGDVMGYLDKSFHDLQRHEKRITEENRFYALFVELKTFVESRYCEDNPKSRDKKENPNLSILAETLREHLNKDSRIIIFVRTRALAEALSTWLNRCNSAELRSLNAHYFTGTNVSENKGGTSQGKQESIIQQFRTGEIRLIVSTSVAEEGLDIPKCNLVIKYNHVSNEVATVQTRGRSRAFGGVSVLLAMNHVLQREFVNQKKAELMKKAIESIRKMSPHEFKAAIKRLQEDIFASVLNKEMAAKKQDHPFKIVCSLCRKVSVENTNVRTIYEKYRISIDGNLLKKIKIYPMPPKPMDELLFVGRVKCMGEIQPGKICFNPLGNMIKYKDIHFVAIGIKNVVFNLGNNTELRQFKQWSKIPYPIDELNDDDILRYLPFLRQDSDTAGDDLEDTDSSQAQTKRRGITRQNSDTDVKKPY